MSGGKVVSKEVPAGILLSCRAVLSVVYRLAAVPENFIAKIIRIKEIEF